MRHVQNMQENGPYAEGFGLPLDGPLDVEGIPERIDEMESRRDVWLHMKLEETFGSI